MEEQEPETTDKTELSDVMDEFYSTLAITQANIFLYLRGAKDEEDLKTRATEVTEQLVMFRIDLGEGQCASGTIWNPITQRCE